MIVRGIVRTLRRGAIAGCPQPNIPIVTVLSLFIGVAVCAGATVSIPTLDQMAGDWIKAANVLNPPAIDNRRDMIQVRYDLVSTRFNPGSTMMPQTATGVPLPVLRLDGREYPAQEMRWAAYEAKRRNLNCDGLQVETAVRMIQEEQGFLTRITLHNTSNKARPVLVELQIPENTVEEESAGQAPIAVNRTFRRGWISTFEPVQEPDRSLQGGNSITWGWQLSLPSDGSYTLEYVVGSDRVGEAEVVARTRLWAGTFSKLFDDCKHSWEQRWAEAFTPGNGHFSGSLPVFEIQDEALRRIYYMSVLTVLACERSQFRISLRDFLTETDRPGKQYFWDASMMATVWALLEPQGMKASLRHWLVGDLLHSHGFNIDSGKDMSPGWYAFSGANVFYTTLTYMRVTGDLHFLDEVLVPCNKTVLSRLDDIAMLWKQRVEPGQTLANWGAANNLLESGDPTYLGAVASLNAQSVGQMREMAKLYAFKGNLERAKQLREEADKLLPAVLGLYKPAEGVWDSILNDGTRAEQRHVVDFIYVSQAISPDLTNAMRREMLGFVKRELVMKNWLRAMSLKDPGAKKSTRPDHGPMGSYDGWIPLTVAEMSRLGDWRDAVGFLRRTEIATHEGPYAQAHEFCGPARTTYAAPICIATGPTIPPFEQWTPSRGQSSGGYSSKECIAGGAFADVVIGTLFGFQPDWQGGMLTNSHAPRPFVGKLRNLRYRDKLYDVSAGSGGVAIEESRPAHKT